MLLKTPPEFSLAQNLAYLARSSDEVLHTLTEAGTIFKALPLTGGPILFKLHGTAEGLEVTFLNRPPEQTERVAVAEYVRQWFDLTTDLRPFYRLGRQDAVLAALLRRYYGLRLIGIPDLFEALAWAIIGQQINVAFAYTVKRRFVETFGEQLTHEGRSFWLFPRPELVAGLKPADLRPLQFSIRKAEYIIDLARLLADGHLSKAQLAALGHFEPMQQALTAIRGVGHWTANYVLMRCFQHPAAFPMADVGLHNALKQAYGLAQKPTPAEIKARFRPWQGWEAYLTFYLWRVLL